MRRIHFYELHDFEWFPGWLREYVLQFLTLIWQPPYNTLFAPLGLRASRTPADLCSDEIAAVLEQCPHHQHQQQQQNRSSQQKDNAMADQKSAPQHTVLDTCSGSGGPIATIAQRVNARRSDNNENAISTRFVLSDLYPQTDTFKRIAASQPNISFEEKSINATNVEVSGTVCLRALCLSFHHFTPALGTSILRDCVLKRQPIAIFETMKRTPGMILKTILLFPILMCIGLVYLKPFSLKRIFWAIVIPVIPFILLFDGIVSLLRWYSPPELQELITAAEADIQPELRFRWEIKEVWTDLLPFYIPHVSEWIGSVPLTSLIGVPDPAYRAKPLPT